MSQVFIEGRRPGEFLLTEGPGQISREAVTVAAGAGIIAPGTVLGRLTASGKCVPSPASGQDGSETAMAIALYGCDATGSDQKIAVIARHSEVKPGCLSFHSSVDDEAKKAAKLAQLAALGVIARA